MSHPTARAIALALFAATAVGYAVTGPLLYETPIDLDSPAFPAGGAIQQAFDALGLTGSRPMAGPVWIAASLLLVALCSFAWVRRAARRSGAAMDRERRRFLGGALAGAAAAAAATALALGAAFSRAFLGWGRDTPGWGPVFEEIFRAPVPTTSPVVLESWKGARIRSRRRLGRTGWPVSDIAMGGSRLRGAKGSEILRRALDRGVNYVDTAPDYSDTGSEQAVAEGIRGRREQVFLATKFCTPRGHLGAGAPVAEYKGVVEASLRRLRTDYVDLVHVHACDEIERLADPNLHEAFERLREEGKVRFLGFSSHTPNLVRVASRAIADGRFDVMMLAYHHGIWPQLPQVIDRARREADMGVVAMKTLKGARHRGLQGFEERGESYSQAALRWVLSNPSVSSAIISFSELQHVDEYLAASGGDLHSGDLDVLREYDRRIAGTYCAPHCGACQEHCPVGLPIPDVLRYRMYFEDYGDRAQAVRRYARLPRDAGACLSCSAPCAGSCPRDVAIRERMIGAHRLLGA